MNKKKKHWVILFLISCSLFLCSGTYAVMSVMIGGVVDRHAPDSDFEIWDNVTNSSIIDIVARDKHRVQIAAAVTLLSGVFQVSLKQA